MPVTLKSTKTIELSPHCLVYGPAKSGKTRLIATLDNPVVCSTDAGLSVLSSFPKEYPCEEYTDWAGVEEFLKWVVGSNESKQFAEVVFDDLTEMCGLYLIDAMKRNKDGRQAYGAMAERILKLIRDMRAIKQHTVVFLCKQERIQDEEKRLIYTPMIPGNAIQPLLPYMWSQIYHMETLTHTDGKVYECLRCKRSNTVEAGDRSGRLGETEWAHLGDINRKVMGL